MLVVDLEVEVGVHVAVRLVLGGFVLGRAVRGRAVRGAAVLGVLWR